MFSSCEVRNPSKKCTNGIRVASEAAWATSARSWASCTRDGGEQREAGLPDRHHVGVVAEDGQALRGQRPGRHVQDRGGQLPGDLVHVGDHQQQALRRGERGGQRAALQRAVQRARRAALALHLHHRRHAAPQVRPALAGPLVGQLGHGRGRGDRVDAAHLVEPVGDRHRRLVAVDRGAHQPFSPDHLDGVHRALVVARAAAGAPVVVEAVAVARAELDHGVLRAGAQAAVALEAVAAGQAAARLVAGLLAGEAADHLGEVRDRGRPGHARAGGAGRRR